jgi:hypothetical protein
MALLTSPWKVHDVESLAFRSPPARAQLSA